MAKKIKKLVDPVIIIPGITATCLLDQYQVSHDMVWSMLTKKFDRVALHPDNLIYEAQEPARVKPGQILDVAYNELAEELRYNLREKEDLVVPVYPFGYDWRMPLERTEAELDAFVKEVIDRTKLLRHYHENGYDENPKVNLIGHSMGGLVITGYLASVGNKAPVNKVVTLATPFRGSFEAVMKIATGSADIGTSSSASRERETARITPALYYLLPMFKNGINFDRGIPDSIFDPDAWQPSVIESVGEFIRLKGLPTANIKGNASELFRTLLLQAEAHWKKIADFKLENAGLNEKSWMAVVGVNAKTRVKLNIIKRGNAVDLNILTGDRDNQWENSDPALRRFTGDGTVPYEGAIPPFLNEENLICVTPQDYGYWETADRALSVVGGFHGILPNMNMIHRLIVRFFKELDDKRDNTWGQKAPVKEAWDPPLKLKLKEIELKNDVNTKK